MAEVLNPTLYRRLQRLYGKVTVSNQGEAMKFKAVKDNEDKPMLSISHKGEYYSANCPFCRDTKKRLYVNHMYGKKDDFGRRMTFLANCFNESCLAKKENRDQFVADLEQFGALEDFKVSPGIVVSEEANEVEWPGPCWLLSKLPVTHPARGYLEERGFDIDWLSETFQISYCTESRYYFARDRIIIPIFDRGKLRGWQARYVGELDWKTKDREKKRELPPKYFSCPGAHFRSKCIYNYDTMKQWRTGVLVEGPTDTWRGVSMFGCIFGNTVTDIQRRRLVAVFQKKERSLVMCLDPEERNSRSTKSAIEYFDKKLPGQFCAVWLPEGTDPGYLDRDWLKAYIKEQAAEQGVKVVYRKVLQP